MQIDKNIFEQYKKCEIPKFADKNYTPPKIRTKRRHTRKNFETHLDFYNHGTCSIDWVVPDTTDKLFEEIHWCCYQLRHDSKSNAEELYKRISEVEEELVLFNRPLILKELATWKKLNNVIDLKDDMRQECLQHLVKAIRSYEPFREKGGSMFYTYASLIIKRKLINRVRDLTKRGDIEYYTTPDEDVVEKILETEPKITTSDLSKKINLSEKTAQKIINKVNTFKHRVKHPLSLNSVDTDTETELINLIPDESYDVAEDISIKSLLALCEKIVLKHFPERDFLMFKLHFIEQFNLTEIAKKQNLSRTTISFRLNRVVDLLKEELCKDFEETFKNEYKEKE
jgi:RNA polymerase sigma factor (sigma-70 family)